MSVDGRTLVDHLDGLPIWVDPGEHVFTFSASGAALAARTWVIKEGEKDRKERVELEPVVVVAPTPPPAAPPPAPAHQGVGAQKVLGLTVASVGLAGLATGAVFGLLTLSLASEQKTDCASPTSCASRANATSDHATAETDGAASTADFSAGARWSRPALRCSSAPPRARTRDLAATTWRPTRRPRDGSRWSRRPVRAAGDSRCEGSSDVRGGPRAWVLVGAALASACSAIVGLTDVPGLPEGGARDAGPDATVDAGRDAARDGARDSRTKPPSDAGSERVPGCTASSECDAGEACDPATGSCGTRCGGGVTCNGGCCSGFTCQSGTDAGACGRGGSACEICTTERPLCSPAGTCGCVRASECPVGQACFEGSCGTKCSGGAPCNQGCCEGTKGFGTGTCVDGTEDLGCGNAGEACATCSGGCPAPVCVATDGGGGCGCSTSGQCGSCSTTATCFHDAGTVGVCR